MLYTNVKDVKQLTNQLYLKYNQNKSILDFLPKLQAGSSIKATIIGFTAKNELICNTQYGRVIIPNNTNLQKGNVITFSLNLNNQSSQNKTISIDYNDPKSNQTINLLYALKPQNHTTNNNNTTHNTHNTAAINNITQVPYYEVDGNIPYLNLSKINQKSLLFEYLSNIKNNNTNPNKQTSIQSELNNKAAQNINYTTSDNNIKSDNYRIEMLLQITVKIIQNYKQTLEPNQLLGEIFEGNASNNQLIKTNFGIISLNNTNFQIGQKIVFEITKINNKIINNNITADIAELMIKINNNWKLLKNLIPNDTKNDNNRKKIHNILNSIEKESYTEYENIKPKGLKSDLPYHEQKETVKYGTTDNTQDRSYTDYKLKNYESTYQSPNRKTSENSIFTTTNIKDTIKDLSNTFNNIKLYFLNHEVSGEQNTIQQMVTIPFLYKNNIINQNVIIKKTKNNVINFNINLELTSLGQIQIFGLIHFRQSTKIVENLDLTIRSSENKSQMLKHKLQSVFTLYKDISNINGSINFEEF